MKRILVSVFLIFLFLFSNSQSKHVGFLIKTGINNAHFNLPKQVGFDDRIINNGNVENFQGGLLANIFLSNHLSVQSGFIINGKGGKTLISEYFLYETSEAKPVYLELPLNLIYNLHLSKRMSFFAGSGVYVSFGVAGKNKYEGSDGDFIYHPYSGNRSITYGKYSGPEGRYNRLRSFDKGLNFIGGFQYKRFQVYTNYGIGLEDVKPKGGSEKMGRNRVLSFGAGYTFYL